VTWYERYLSLPSCFRCWARKSIWKKCTLELLLGGLEIQQMSLLLLRFFAYQHRHTSLARLFVLMEECPWMVSTQQRSSKSCCLHHAPSLLIFLSIAIHVEHLAWFSTSLSSLQELVLLWKVFNDFVSLVEAFKIIWVKSQLKKLISMYINFLKRKSYGNKFKEN